MDFKGIRVLLCDGNGRQSVTICRELREIGCIVTVLCSSKLDVSYASRLPHKKILDVNADSSSEGFVDFVRTEIQTGKYDLLFPILESSTNKITLNETEFSKYVKIACAPRDAYIQAANKQLTFSTAQRIGIPCPYTRMEDQPVDEYLDSATFPIIIKPRSGMGSVGFHKFNTRSDFTEFFGKPENHVDDYVVQEFVKHEKQLSGNIFMDSLGNVCAAYSNQVLRWYPVDAGTPTAVRNVNEPVIVETAARLLKALRWQGFANVSFMIDAKTGEPRLNEINGRIPASIKMSRLCGFNIAKLMVEMAYGEKVDVYPPVSKFNMLTRYSQCDFLWFLESPKRFSVKPSWFRIYKTWDVIFYIDDPLPYFAHTIQKVRQLKEIKERKKH